MPDEVGPVLVSGCDESRPRALARLLGLFRKIAGMPDYSAYLEHCRLHHPERRVLTQRQFFEEYLRSRYGDGPTRCC